MVPVSIRHSLVFALLFASSAGCSSNGVAASGADTPAPESTAGAEPSRCPPFSSIDAPLPRVTAAELTLDYWLKQIGRELDLDEVLLDPRDIAALNASAPIARGDYFPQRDLSEPLDVARLQREVDERRAWAREKLTRGEFVTAAGSPVPAAALAPLEHDRSLGAARPELRVVLADAVIHCVPIPESFFLPSLDLRLDRNACSVLRSQDVVRVVAEWPNGMTLVEAAFSYGWLPKGTALSPPIPAKLAPSFLHGPSVQVIGGPLGVGEGGERQVLAAGTRLPASDRRGTRAHVATAHGFVQSPASDAARLRSTRRGLTRRALLEEAWRFIGTPYGLGDTSGARDCSRLLLDVFSSFDVRLPRHSSWQSKAGSFWIDIERVPEQERLSLLDAATKKGIVLLHFPGHIMLYLGKNDRGRPMVLHALGEYPESCGGGQETLVRVQNISVSDLELGRGTSRTALIERLTRITVLGAPPGVELAGVAQTRPAAPPRLPSDRGCHDSESAAIYALPEHPNRSQPLRVVAALKDDPGPAELSLVDPDGVLLSPERVRLGGPPYGQVVTVENPKRGRWKAILADGDRVLACQTIAVAGRARDASEPDAGPIWLPKYRWNAANENLYALFVERLFDYELSEDRVWKNLHTLLRDRDKNLLFGYRGQDEDEQLELVPDCADLPYALRAYFAWKMRLPFGFRRCTRGRSGKPPRCDQPGAGDDLLSRLEMPGKGGRMLPRGDVEAFSLFVKTQLASGVHSSSGRTTPDDERTDYYPVALDRAALSPGTVFADPYGHFLVLAKWIPQGLDGYGMLVGVDAQPDGTIGQRRFWRGTFLFDPDTKSGGAGFKAFRPRTFVAEPASVELEVDAEAAANAAGLEARAPAFDDIVDVLPPAPSVEVTARRGGDQQTLAPRVRVQRPGRLEDVGNEELRRGGKYERLSFAQYEGSADDFYARMEALINPRPLQPETVQRALIDALEEAVVRRVVSVQNGETWAREHPGDVVAMPDGEGIFLSAGPWEDFSTPSRDLRLLIAIDTVRSASESVRRHPERYALRGRDPAAAAAELERELGASLAQRTFSYVRSDGSEQRLTLGDVVTRAPALEMAYNPNDCVEVRWGAVDGTPEMATCRRRAPDEQRARMAKYRGWFSTRTRPPQ